MEEQNQKSILIIEDEPGIRDFICRVLQMEGYRVFQAGDGESGLKMARKRRFDLILLDVGLPGIGGFAVLRALKSGRKFERTAVVMMTASIEAGLREQALRAGAADFLAKPMSAGSLRQVVAQILG